MLDRMGVRARIITGALLIVSVVLAALGVVLWRAMATALSTTAHESVVGAVAEIAGDLKDGSLEAALRLDDQPNPLRVRQVLDDQGNVLAWSRASVRGGALADVAELPEVDQIVTEPRSNLPRLGKGAVIVGSTRVVAEDGRTLTVLASEPATISNAAATKLGLVMLAIGLAALAVLAVVLTYAVRSALDPVVRMSEDLESINSSREDRGVDQPPRAHDQRPPGPAASRRRGAGCLRLQRRPRVAQPPDHGRGVPGVAVLRVVTRAPRGRLGAGQR
jgi:hypothetical protein